MYIFSLSKSRNPTAFFLVHDDKQWTLLIENYKEGKLVGASVEIVANLDNQIVKETMFYRNQDQTGQINKFEVYQKKKIDEIIGDRVLFKDHMTIKLYKGLHMILPRFAHGSKNKSLCIYSRNATNLLTR